MRSLHSYITVVAAAALLPINTLALLSSSTSTTKIIRQTPPTFLKSSLSSSPSLPSFTVLESTIETTETDKTLDLTGKNNGGSSKNLSPFLQDMVDEQRELQMNVGKAMDVLRKDYPYFLRRAPDYSIYHNDITLKASDNITPQLSKLSSYKQTFSILRTMLSLIYDVDKSIIQSRMVYDPTKQQIRVSFNANLTPKILGGRIMHVDGISVYSIDLSKRIIHQNSPPSTTRDEKNNQEERGKIIEHRIEKLLVNGTPLQPPYFNVFGLEDLMVSNGQYGSGALVGAGAWS